MQPPTGGARKRGWSADFMVENAEDFGWADGMTGTSEAAHGAASIENESYCDISLVRKKSV